MRIIVRSSQFELSTAHVSQTEIFQLDTNFESKTHGENGEFLKTAIIAQPLIISDIRAGAAGLFIFFFQLNALTSYSDT